MGSTYNEAQKKASIKYLSEKTDDIRIRAPKGEKAEIQAAAKKQGESMNAYILGAIDKRMKSEGLDGLPAKPEDKSE